MSWLRDHFHNFVFPAFMAAEKKSTEMGEPFDVRPSPHAPEKLPSELKKLWTLCKENEVPWEYDVREVNVHAGSSKYRERAKVDHNVLNTTLDSAMAAMRAEGCDRLFLGGRDVWAFAVMCERRRIPYLYVPELSRYVSGRPEVRPFLEKRGFRGDKELFLDTGYAGSIPRNLKAHFPEMNFKFRLMSQTEQFVHTPGQEGGVYDTATFPHREHRQAKKERWKRFPNQLFPNRKKAREEAMFQEYVAKYQRSGTFNDPMKGPPIGHAPTVFKEWLHKPNIWRYDDAKTRMLCMTNGKDAIGVGLNDVKIAPGFYEWWKSLPKGPVWVPPNHTMGEIVQYLSDRRTIQRAALLTSQLWRGIPSWKAMTVDKPAPKANIYMAKMGDPVLNTANIDNFTIGAPGIITSSANSSVVTYTTNGSWGLMPPGFSSVVKTDGPEPVMEITKSQLGLFENFPGKGLKVEPAPLSLPVQLELALPVPKPKVDKTQSYQILQSLGCDCGPEEACSECPKDKILVEDNTMMTEDTFNQLFPTEVTFT